jgi:hypothetical protein
MRCRGVGSPKLDKWRQSFIEDVLSQQESDYLGIEFEGEPKEGARLLAGGPDQRVRSQRRMKRESLAAGETAGRIRAKQVERQGDCGTFAGDIVLQESENLLVLEIDFHGQREHDDLEIEFAQSESIGECPELGVCVFGRFFVRKRRDASGSGE